MKKITLIILLAAIFAIPFQPANAQKSMTKAVISVSGRIYDEISRKAVGVSVVVTDESGKKVFSTKSLVSENGSYFVTSLKPGEVYTFTLSQDGYFTEVYQLQMPNSEKYVELSRDFLVMPLDRGLEFKLAVAPFELNKSKPKVGFEFLLDEWKSALEKNPNVTVKIICYPDNDNSQAENAKLTEERAIALKNFFVSTGVNGARIKTEGSQTTDPKNPPPVKKGAKGKRYIGTSYIVIEGF